MVQFAAPSARIRQVLNYQVLLAKAMGKAHRCRRQAVHQGDVLVLALFVGQLETGLPGADGLTISKAIDLFLGHLAGVGFRR